MSTMTTTALHAVPSHPGAPNDGAAIPEAWLPASPFAAHVKHLLAGTPLTASLLAAVAGVPQRTVASLAAPTPRPHQRIRHVDALRLLQVTPTLVDDLQRRRVDALRESRRLQRLLRHGWTVAAISEASQVPPRTITTLLRGEGRTVPALTALRLRSVPLDGAPSTPADPRVGASRSQRPLAA